MESLTKLLDEGVWIKTANHNGETPMMHAICKNKKHGYNITKLLIERGALVNFESDYGKTALICAIYMYRFDICLELLNNGANIELKTSAGYTPLMIASMCGFSKMVRELIIRNANINCKMSPNNKSVLDVIYNCGYIREFLSRDFEVNQNEYKPDEVIDLLLEAGADVNHRTTNGDTPLFHNRNTLTIKKFLKYGADKNIKNNDGLTAYDYAMEIKLHRFYPENYDLLRPDNNISPTHTPITEANTLPSYNMLFNTRTLG